MSVSALSKSKIEIRALKRTLVISENTLSCTLLSTIIIQDHLNCLILGV